MKASTLWSVLRARVLNVPAPVAVGFELTHQCNLACEYCDRHTKLPGEMSFEQITSALDGLHGIGMRECSLDGGDPLTHPRVGDVVDHLLMLGVVVRMNTNGILVRKKSDVVRKLAKVKISLDGPQEVHDRVRGKRAFERAIDGANVARELGVPVEFTCVVGAHNADHIDDLVQITTVLDFPIIFQPARESLFVGNVRGPGRSLVLERKALSFAFSRVEHHKREGKGILNGWASLRHFRGFPEEQELPCAAGFINATLDPRGNLYHCGQVARGDAPNVVLLGAEEAFRRLTRVGCGQCWCARVVEENYAWGGRFDMQLPLRPNGPRESAVVPATSLVRKGPLAVKPGGKNMWG